MFITYVVLDPRKPGSFSHPFGVFDHQPAYVGKGRPNRPLDIVTFLEGGISSYSGQLINNWLKGMRSKGFTSVPVIAVYEGDELTAFAVERVLTKHFGIKPEGGILFNGRHGGEDGWSLSEDARKNLSVKNIGENNPNFGSTWSDERRKKFLKSWSKKDRTRSPETMKSAWAATQRTYEITTNTGEVLTTTDLTKFCEERSLPLSTLRKALNSGVITSKKRPSRVDGWSIKYST
jgi:hypothetical protein